MNLRDPSEILETEVVAAIARIAAADSGLGDDAQHVYDVLTGGEGPSVLRQSRLQAWLWYEVPNKYVTDEVGYKEHLAVTASLLFDELGLHRYAAICRSQATAEVHAAFDDSDSAGFAALRKAMQRSGVEPPDLDGFEWSGLMGIEEATARDAVSAALERALAAGKLTVGARGWRKAQAALAVAALDSDHDTQPGQSWRTAVITERLQRWVTQGEMMSERLAEARSQVANRLLHPIEPVPSALDAMAVPMWLLRRFGDSQPLTQAGNLKVAFIRSLHEDCPWGYPEQPPGYQQRHVEADDTVLWSLRAWLQRGHALRRRHNRLHRTAAGAQMVDDAALAWERLTRHLLPSGWDGFVAELAAVLLAASDDGVDQGQLELDVAETAADLGWRSSVGGEEQLPPRWTIMRAFSESRHLWRECGLLTEEGDYGERRLTLTSAGTAAVLTHLRLKAAGPRHQPF